MSLSHNPVIACLKPIVLALFLAAGVFQASAAEQATVHYFDLPAQPLQSGLIEFAMQANITIIADNTLIGDYKSVALSGPMAMDTALLKLLSETQLECHYRADTDSYILEKKSAAAESLVLPRENFIEEMVVVGQPVYPFRYNTVTNTQNQSGRAYFDASRFLNVIPQQLIKDQQAGELSSLLKFASGITPGDGAADSNDDIYIRGFQRHAIYVDGFRLSSSVGIKLLPTNIERVEILKGPSTMLFGQAEPGGIVNVIRKKPQDDNFVLAEVAAGRFGYRDISVDINHQLPLDEDIDIRLVLAKQDQDQAREIADIDKQLAASSMVWKLSPETTLDLGYEYQQAEQTTTRDVQVFLPYEDFAGLKLNDILRQGTPEFAAEFKLFNAEINHYFNADWHVRMDYFWQDEWRYGVRATEGILQNTDLLFKSGELGSDYLLLAPANIMTIPIIIYPQSQVDYNYAIGKIRSLYDQQEFETANNASLTLDGTFSAFSLLNKVAMGGRWSRQDIFKEYLVEVQDPFANQIWPSEQFLAVLPGIAATLSDPLRPYGDFERRNYWLVYDEYGVFAQDNITINDDWQLSAGTGYTITQGDYTADGSVGSIELPTYKKFSSQLGATYTLDADKSFFANYSEALRANYHVDDVGSQPANPELSNQFEVGFKGQGLDGHFLSSLAFFNIDKDNVVDLSIVDDVRQSLAAHSINAKGIDYDFTWQYSDAIDVVGALSLIKPSIVSGVNKNNIPALAAKQSASLFIHTQLSSNFEFSSGINYVGKRFADNENKFPVDSYSTADLNLIYTLRQWLGKPKLQLSVRNIADAKYYTAVLGGVRQNTAEGRMLVGKIGVEF